jgi:hypothetical protein
VGVGVGGLGDAVKLCSKPEKDAVKLQKENLMFVNP